MKKFLAMFGVIILVIVMSGCGSGNDDPAPEPEGFIWMLSVTGGDGVAEDNGDGSYSVIYSNVDHQVLAHSNNPEEEVGVGDMDSLMNAWPLISQDSGSVGTLHYTLADGSTKDVSVLIEEPIYDEATGEFQFKATPLNDGDTLESNFSSSSLSMKTTLSPWTWAKLVLECGLSIASIAVAAVQGGADPVSDVMAAGASADCVLEVKKIWG